MTPRGSRQYCYKWFEARVLTVLYWVRPHFAVLLRLWSGNQSKTRKSQTQWRGKREKFPFGSRWLLPNSALVHTSDSFAPASVQRCWTVHSHEVKMSISVSFKGGIIFVLHHVDFRSASRTSVSHLCNAALKITWDVSFEPLQDNWVSRLRKQVEKPNSRSFKERKKRFFFKILPSSAHMRNKKHRRCWRGLYRGCSVSLQPLLTWNVAPVSREPLKNAEVAPLKRAKLERYTLVEDCIHSTVKMCNLALSSSFLHCCDWFDTMCVENGLTVCPGEMFFR